MKLLILGCTGLIGNGLFSFFSSFKDIAIRGTTRDQPEAKFYQLNNCSSEIIYNFNAEDIDQLLLTIDEFRPDLVINCIGVVKQKKEIFDLKKSIYINSLFPHILSEACEKFHSRLIHFSTDCVYSGTAGSYSEIDIPDPIDFYGKSKLLGEPIYNSNSITIRTSVIGHELNTKHGLFEWFLSQEGKVTGFSNAYFSGLTSLEIGKILYKHIIFKKDLSGLYHLSSNRIDKFSLLNLIQAIYKKNITIEKDDIFKIDRSLNCENFQKKTGYIPKSMTDQIVEMKVFFEERAV